MEQVHDDPELLSLMLADAKEAGALYQTTNYWAFKEKSLVPELRARGLHDFRRRRDSYLASFGATDLRTKLHAIDLYRSPVWNNTLLRKVPLWSRVLSASNRALNAIAPSLLPLKSDVSYASLQELMYEFARLFGEAHGAKPLQALDASIAGNPEDAFIVEGRHYTYSMLYYYMRYAYCAGHADFDALRLVVELGCGSGKQIEVLKKLHPKLTFVIMDIPPQLYVCEQYLKAVFPQDTVSYRDTRRGLPERLEEGKIYILGNWSFPLTKGMPVDLFWNAASFQEMEPTVVLNYLRDVNASAKHVYLQEMMGGTVLAAREGQKGVLEQTTLAHYKQGLPDFTVTDLSPSWTPLGILRGNNEYSDSFWTRS